jgi:hypothetical protein
MNTTFTHKFMEENCGCYHLGRLRACSFMQNQTVTLESILDSEIPLKDKFWFVCKKLATKEQNQQIAIGVAEVVLHVYEDKHPEDDRPRKAIEAAKAYLAGAIGVDELRERRAAADAAADDGSYAAAPTAAATAAADAADAAAAAYDTAAAAYDAAYAADAAAAATDLKETLLNFLKEFCTTPVGQ